MKIEDTPFPERVERLWGLFDAALNQEEANREDFLSRACGGDISLKEELITLIAKHEKDSHFLERPAWESLAEQPVDDKSGSPDISADPDLPFENLGEFRLIRRLGEGGMGVVYLAMQESVGREVALKVIRPELMGLTETAKRFAREVEAISRLRHPNIVTLFGSGQEQNVLYFAMELLPGKGLDDELREVSAHGERIPTTKVLRWIKEIAWALESAHGSGIVHRDVKPSNIRITAKDQAVLTDFSIARHTNLTSLTLTGEFRGTLSYSSPEQVEARPREIDCRTDVYSLGATLYEAITGRVPFEGDTTKQVLHQIIQKEPVSPRRLNSAISRDLETVILKALEKDPDRRYRTAADFADDLDRILNGEMILARPAGPGTRFWKRVRRYPVTSTAIGIALSTVLCFAGYVLLVSYPGMVAEQDKTKNALKKAKAARVEAENQAQVATTVTRFLCDRVLSSFEPRIVDDADLVKRMVTNAEKYIETDLASAPLAEVLVRQKLGKICNKNTDWESAADHYTKAIELGRADLGEDHPETLRCLFLLAENLQHGGYLRQSEQQWRCSLELAEPVLGKNHPDVGRAVELFSGVLQANLKHAESLELARKYHTDLLVEYGEDDPGTLNAKWILASVLSCSMERGNLKEGKRLMRYCLARRRETLEREDPGILGILHELANIAETQGEYTEQLNLRSQWVEGHDSCYGFESARALESRIWLAEAVDRTGQFEEAERAYRETLEKSRKKLGEEDVVTSLAKCDLAVFWTRRGRYDDAEVLHYQALRSREKTSRGDGSILWSMFCIIDLHRRKGEYDRSVEMSELAWKQPRFQKVTSQNNFFLNTMARLHEDMKNYEEAEGFYRQSLSIAEKKNQPQHPRIAIARVNLACFFILHDRYAEAEPLLRRALSVLEELTPRHFSRFVAMSALGMALAGQERCAEAEPFLLESHDGLEGIPYSYYADDGLEAIERLVKLYELLKKPVRAEKWQRKLAALLEAKRKMKNRDYSPLKSRPVPGEER